MLDPIGAELEPGAGAYGLLLTGLAHDFAELRDFRHAPMGQYSFGMRLRLAFSIAMALEPDVLLLDEPTNNLDPASREEILRALASFQGAVVLVSHDEGAVLSLNPERVLILPDGDEDLWNDSYADLISLS